MTVRDSGVVTSILTLISDKGELVVSSLSIRVLPESLKCFPGLYFKHESKLVLPGIVYFYLK